MAAFQFRLAAVLRVREHARDEKRWELRALNEVRRRMAAEIRALENELSAHAQRIGERIRGKRLELEQLERQLIAQRAELVEAMRAVKSLEQLRKRQAEKFQREEESRQQKFLDEVAQRPFVGRASGKKIPR